jgi:transposase
MLWELQVAEQRYAAVREVLEGASVTEVARRFGVSRQTVHAWLNRYAADGGLGGLGDRSSRPHGCPHQMSPVVEARIVELREAHRMWGPDRIGYQLGRDGVVPVPGRSSIYRALVRHGLVVAEQRRRRRGLPAVGAGPADGVVADGCGRRLSPGRWDRAESGQRA